MNQILLFLYCTASFVRWGLYEILVIVGVKSGDIFFSLMHLLFSFSDVWLFHSKMLINEPRTQCRQEWNSLYASSKILRNLKS